MAVEGAILPAHFGSNELSNNVPPSPVRFRMLTNNVGNLNNPSTSTSASANSSINSQQPSTSQYQTSAPQPGSAPGMSNQVNMVAYLPRPAYRFKPQQVSAATAATEGEGYGRRLRRSMAQVRRHIDCVASVLNYLENRSWQSATYERPFLQPHVLYSTDSYPPIYCPDKPIDCVTTKFVRAAMNKVKCPIYDVCWTPEGRRLITGASSGEFTLWNGTAFNFETILQAHDSAVRAMKWSRNDLWMVTADHDGFVKYWQANMNNVTMFQAHKEAVRSLSFCPGDTKFATASDDGTVRVWDFMRCHEERILRGHGSDVRCVDWHPSKSLLVSGSRDSQQPVKLWDPKTSQCLATLHDHKNAVMAVQWNANGNWMLSASRDHLLKLYDIRMMKEVATFRGHKKEVTSLSWHPIHEGLFVSGGADGAMMFWLVGNEREVGLMETAHEQAVWCLKWHPLGHILASGSNDNNTKFWTRNKAGDILEDFYGMVGGQNPYDQSGQTTAMTSSSSAMAKQQHQMHQAAHVDDSSAADGNTIASRSNNAPAQPANHNNFADRRHDVSGGVAMAIPGMGLGDEVMENLLPGLGGVEDGAGGQGNNFGRKTLLKQPPPKKNQRQFERMWNVSTSYVPDYEESPLVAPDQDFQTRKSKPLLGLAPPGGELPPQPPLMMNANNSMPPPPMMPPPPFGGGRPPPMPQPPPHPASMSNWSSPPHHIPPMEPGGGSMPRMPPPPPPMPPNLWPPPPPNMQNVSGGGGGSNKSLLDMPLDIPQFYAGGDDRQWDSGGQQEAHGDVDLRHHQQHSWQPPAPQQPGGGGDLFADSFYNSPAVPASQQASQNFNPRDPRTQRSLVAAGRSASDLGGGSAAASQYSSNDYGGGGESSSQNLQQSRDPRYQASAAAVSQQDRNSSGDEYSMMVGGMDADGRQPPNPKRKWKQDYEAEEQAQEKRWPPDDEDYEEDDGRGDVDERRHATIMNRGGGRPQQQRRRYN